jgi:hypothetical protein
LIGEPITPFLPIESDVKGIIISNYSVKNDRVKIAQTQFDNVELNLIDKSFSNTQ